MRGSSKNTLFHNQSIPKTWIENFIIWREIQQYLRDLLYIDLDIVRTQTDTLEGFHHMQRVRESYIQCYL